MHARYLKDLHPDDVALWLGVEKACWRLALDQGIRFSAVAPLPRKFVSSYSGEADCVSRRLRISLRYSWHEKWGWGKRRNYAYILDTLVHEMAHLATPHERDDHGPKFFREFSRLLLVQEKLKLRFDLLHALK